MQSKRLMASTHHSSIQLDGYVGVVQVRPEMVSPDRFSEDASWRPSKTAAFFFRIALRCDNLEMGRKGG